jgi:flagellin
MAVVINTNIQSAFAQRTLNRNTQGLQSNLERLASGYRVNKAADDAAGLSISEKLHSRILGYQKSKQNASDGISFIQTAEGSLGIVQEQLQRLRELVIQGLNGSNSSKEADAIQREINERVQIIGDISTQTEFNGVNLLDGSVNKTLQIGANYGDTVTLDLQSGVSAESGIDIDISYAVDGATATNNYGHLVEGISVAGFALDKIHLFNATTVDSLAGSTANVDIVASGATAAQVTLGDLDTIIDNVSRMRSELGAVQNSLEARLDYLDVAIENSEASRSRIKDVDFAYESSRMVKNQILQQSASAMLAQANQLPSIALQLLGG